SYFNVWVQFRKMEIRRDRAVLEHERRLDQSDDAGSALEMADVGLDRADVAGFSVSVGHSNGRAQRLDLNWIAKRCTRAVRLDEADLFTRNTSIHECPFDDAPLR